MGKGTDNKPTVSAVRSLVSFIGDGAEPLHTIEGQPVLVHAISEPMKGNPEFGDYVIIHVTPANDPFAEATAIRCGGVVSEKLLAAKAAIPADAYPVSATFQKVRTKNNRECWSIIGDEEGE